MAATGVLGSPPVRPAAQLRLPSLGSPLLGKVSVGLGILASVLFVAAGLALAHGGSPAGSNPAGPNPAVEQPHSGSRGSPCPVSAGDVPRSRPVSWASSSPPRRPAISSWRRSSRTTPAKCCGSLCLLPLRAALPPAVQGYVEQEVDVEGVLEILHEDGYDGQPLSLRCSRPPIERLSLHFAAAPPTQLLTGARVRVQGRPSQETSRARRRRKRQDGAPAPVPSTLGAQRTLVMSRQLPEQPTEPYTVADAQSMMFGTTSNFFFENSYQQTWLDGDVAGWFTIATTSTVCDTTPSPTRPGGRSGAAGFACLRTPTCLRISSELHCSFWGRPSVGGSPSMAWINGDFELGVTAHEFGHGLGLFHSHSIDCGAETLGLGLHGIRIRRHHGPDGGVVVRPLQSFQKERLGWLNAGASPPIATVQSGGTYTLGTYETAGSGPKALKILKSTDPVTGERTWYYVHSARRSASTRLSANPIAERHERHADPFRYRNANSSYLLDLTPASGRTIDPDWRDPALAVGQTFIDPAAGVIMTTDG